MPSQKGAPFKRKDIAKAFFDLDLSDSGPSTASKTPKPRDRNRPVASQPPATNEAEGNNKVTLRLQLLSHYAILKIKEFQQKGKMEDLEEAICKGSQAVEGTSQGYPDLVSRLSNLGIMLESRFERTGKMEDLEKAIRKTRQAIEATF
jgi:hypothetical protein